jgi:hypothetical protein
MNLLASWSETAQSLIIPASGRQMISCGTPYFGTPRSIHPEMTTRSVSRGLQARQI